MALRNDVLRRRWSFSRWISVSDFQLRTRVLQPTQRCPGIHSTMHAGISLAWDDLLVQVRPASDHGLVDGLRIFAILLPRAPAAWRAT